jgi:hypothetical protein
MAVMANIEHAVKEILSLRQTSSMRLSCPIQHYPLAVMILEGVKPRLRSCPLLGSCQSIRVGDLSMKGLQIIVQ